MLIQREIESHLRALMRYFPVVVLTGPRQSGKTTLLKELFPDHEYFNPLEDCLKTIALRN
jgi:predicted AAA+ superfamily ATPase